MIRGQSGMITNGRGILRLANLPLHRGWEGFCNFIGQTEIDRRKNWITQADYDAAVRTLKKGDIILTALYRTIGWAAVFRELVNHAVYYAGNGRVIHARSGGVVEQSLKWLCSYYDGFIILRMKDYRKNRKLIPKIDGFMRSTVGMNYNYSFAERKDSFVCTQLVNEALRSAGYNTDLESFGHYERARKVVPLIFVLKAQRLLTEGNFEIVATSSNYEVVGSSVRLTIPSQKNRLRMFLYEPEARIGPREESLLTITPLQSE